jgi:hypothetical protein
MDWKSRYEDALHQLWNAKNEYHAKCIEHDELIHFVQHTLDIMFTMVQQMRTCSPEDYTAFEEQYHSHFHTWNVNSDMVETLLGDSYRKMIHASELVSIVFYRYLQN